MPSVLKACAIVLSCELTFTPPLLDVELVAMDCREEGSLIERSDNKRDSSEMCEVVGTLLPAVPREGKLTGTEVPLAMKLREAGEFDRLDCVGWGWEGDASRAWSSTAKPYSSAADAAALLLPESSLNETVFFTINLAELSACAGSLCIVKAAAGLRHDAAESRSSHR